MRPLSLPPRLGSSPRARPDTRARTSPARSCATRRRSSARPSSARARTPSTELSSSRSKEQEGRGGTARRFFCNLVHLYMLRSPLAHSGELQREKVSVSHWQARSAQGARRRREALPLWRGRPPPLALPASRRPSSASYRSLRSAVSAREERPSRRAAPRPARAEGRCFLVSLLRSPEPPETWRASYATRTTLKGRTRSARERGRLVLRKRGARACARARGRGNEKNVAWAAGDLLVVAALRRLRPIRLLSTVSRATL